MINVVPGYGPTAGSALARHMKVRKITFTGSVATGRSIMRDAADTNLKVASGRVSWAALGGP